MSSGAGWDYRPMTTDDLDWVIEHEPRLYPFPWSRGNFADSLDAGYLCRIMHEAGRPIGYAVMMVILDEAHLLNLSVVRAMQRHGAGRALLGHLCEAARGLGATQCFLEVRPSNTPALALYESAGFEAVGRRRDYYPDEGGREDALVMRAEL